LLIVLATGAIHLISMKELSPSKGPGVQSTVRKIREKPQKILGKMYVFQDAIGYDC